MMPRSALLWSLFSVAVAGATGCISSGSSTGAANALASVDIQCSDPFHIASVTRQVFEEAGYITTQHSSSEMLFEIEGSRWQTFNYGDWSGKSVWFRAACSVRYLSLTHRALDCWAYLVRERGDARFEEQLRLTALKAGPYKDLLKKVKARVEAPTPP